MKLLQIAKTFFPVAECGIDPELGEEGKFLPL